MRDSPPPVKARTPDTSHVGLHRPFADVYEAAEDSFLFLDALESDLQFLLRRRPSLIIEIGSGSGCIITFLRSLFRLATAASAASKSLEDGILLQAAEADRGRDRDRAPDDPVKALAGAGDAAPPLASPPSACDASAASAGWTPCFLAVDCNLSATKATLETAQRAVESDAKANGEDSPRREAPSGDASDPGDAQSTATEEPPKEKKTAKPRGDIDVTASDLFRCFRTRREPTDARAVSSPSSPSLPPTTASSPSGASVAGATDGLFDVVLFNPPYVPGTPRRPPSPADWAWWGGADGREVIDRFLPHAIAHLSPAGVLYLLLEKQNKIEEVVARMESLGFAAVQVKRRKIHGGEDLSIWRFTRLGSGVE
ncbi:hypothetical protein BESB_014860 [Besnoitia besnoiti]|uniref:Methyltransferase domain protein n=1 Tax=Besnoitia besnoiti TaxID=94643 RepID=A0A2A9MB15_BESBE|nr:hypothetical protein BESB_014860 [Besnoitia besnoiti]PFH32873.1 hypothetical protein BESB_014860 [Besnoitia besnoiti]